MTADAPILYDWAGAPVASGYAPVTSRPGQALNATAQGGIVMLGADGSGVARAPRVDSTGNLYTTNGSPAGGTAMAYTGQAAGAASTQYGNLIMGRQDLPAPSTFYPLTLDQVGSLQVHAKSKQTFTVFASGVTCSSNAILFALQNTSTMVLRINRFFIYIPPSGGTGAALLGQSSGLNYYPVYCELRRAATFSGGTALTPVGSDSQDTLASGITCAKSVTSIGGTAVLFHQADAYATNMTGIPFYERGADQNAKTFVVRPGECAHVVCTSNGVVNSTVAGGGTLQASASLMVTFTQATA